MLSNLNLFTLFPITCFEMCIYLQTYKTFSWNYQDQLLGDLDWIIKWITFTQQIPEGIKE